MRDLWCPFQRVQVCTKKIKRIPFGENQKKAMGLNLENVLKGRDSDRKAGDLYRWQPEWGKRLTFPNETKNCLKCFNTMPLGSVSYFTCIINYKAFTLKVVPGYCCCFFFFFLPHPSQNKTSAFIYRPVFNHTSNIYLIIFFKKDNISSHSEITFIFKPLILLQSRNFSSSVIFFFSNGAH